MSWPALRGLQPLITGGRLVSMDLRCTSDLYDLIATLSLLVKRPIWSILVYMLTLPSAR